MRLTISAYKRLAMIFYYGAIGAFVFADKVYKTDGALTNIGYCYGVTFLIMTFLASTGEQRISDIQAELNGPIATLADKIWKQVERAVFWASIAVSAYFIYKARVWDGIVSLGFPAWRLWLVLEIRRLRISSGEVRPSKFWLIALICSAAAALIFLLLMFLTGYGPYRNLGWGEFQLYPAFFIACIVCSIIFLIGSGAKLK